MCTILSDIYHFCDNILVGDRSDVTSSVVSMGGNVEENK